jgi:hypothetical protein
VPPKGAWCRWAAVARRHDAAVGRGAPPPATSACSRPRADTPATEDDDTVGVLGTVGEFADDAREDGRSPNDEPQPARAGAPEIATAAVARAEARTKGTAQHNVPRDGGRAAPLIDLQHTAPRRRIQGPGPVWQQHLASPSTNHRTRPRRRWAGRRLLLYGLASGQSSSWAIRARRRRRVFGRRQQASGFREQSTTSGGSEGCPSRRQSSSVLSAFAGDSGVRTARVSAPTACDDDLGGLGPLRTRSRRLLRGRRRLRRVPAADGAQLRLTLWLVMSQCSWVPLCFVRSSGSAITDGLRFSKPDYSSRRARVARLVGRALCDASALVGAAFPGFDRDHAPWPVVRE